MNSLLLVKAWNLNSLPKKFITVQPAALLYSANNGYIFGRLI